MASDRFGPHGTQGSPIGLGKLGQGLRGVGVHVGAHGAVGALGKPLETLLQHGLDVVLDGALANSLQEAALRLHLLQRLPDLPGQLVRQPLHVPGTARGVRRLEQVELLAEHHLSVARDTTGELRPRPQRLVETADGQAVDAAHNAGEGLRRVAQHVHVGIVHGLGEERGAAEDLRPLRLPVAAEARGDLGPDAARGPDLGDLHEEIGAQGELESKPAGELRDVDAPLLKRPQGLDGRGHGVGDLLNRAGPPVVEDGAPDQDRSQRGFPLTGPDDRLRHLVEKRGEGGRKGALLQERGEGIRPHAPREIAEGNLPFRGKGVEQGEERQCGRPRMDIEGMAARQIFEQCLQVLEGGYGDPGGDGPLRIGIKPLQGAAVQDEGDGRGSAVELVYNGLVGLLGQSLVAELSDLPGTSKVAGRRGSAQGIGPRESPGCLEVPGIRVRVERVERNSLVGGGEHALLEGRPLQGRNGRLLPSLVARRGELAKIDLGQGHRG